MTVYNGKGEPLYGFNSAQKYLMTAAVSENGNYMAAAAMGQDGGSFTSSLQIYKLTSDALQADAAPPAAYTSWARWMAGSAPPRTRRCAL